MLLLVVALAGAVSGCTVPMGTLRPGPVTAIDGKAMPVTDARSLRNVRDEWMRFDFDSDMDYARLIRRRELNVYVRVRWCGRGGLGRELTTARLFGQDGRVDAANRLEPVPAGQPMTSTVFRYHAYVPVRVPKDPVMPPGRPDQGGDYDLRHPADDVCLSVGGGDMVGNHGESTFAVYPRDVPWSALAP
jgi:hypothetical protein